MAAQASINKGQVLVNKQFNSPIKMYSAENVAEVLNKQTQVLENGAVGIDFHQLSAPGHLANSAVLRMLAEEERQRGGALKEESPPPLTPAAEGPAAAQAPARAPAAVAQAVVTIPTEVHLEDGKPRRGLKRYAWPPKEYGIGLGFNNVTHKHPLFSSKRFPIGQGLKRVAWPPPPDGEGPLIESQPAFAKFQGTIPGQPGQPQYPPPLQPYQYPSYQAPPAFEPPPSTIVLRPEPPINQAPFPVFESQPAAIRAAAPKMRGDEKWPPTEYKARAAAENEQRLALARGPAVRPRKVNRDYTKFFAQNQLTPNYPSYKAPPGTQHYVEEGTSNF